MTYMKKSLLIAVIFCNVHLIAQNVKYEIILNDPQKHPKLSVNTDLVQLDAGLNNGWRFI